ncbi:MAG: glycosyltransferase family 2 protein [Candidatus Aenigmarchaeota archaeon]|nr:glycosyltransferase family 2 protein [Candidatus Aenigmarchaeota archaeon]
MYKGLKVSVVIPAYNEEESIFKTVKDFSQPCVDEIIVVDNNCTDKTPELARKAGAKVIKQPLQGYGFAIRKGLEKAKGDVIIITEADQTFIGKDVYKLLAYIEDADMVLGTRTCLQLVSKDANMGRFFLWGNIFIAKLIQFFYGNVRLTDVGCTMRAIRKKALKKIIKKFLVGGSHFSPEMIIEALKANLKIVEVPLNYRKRIGIGKITSSGKWRAFKVGLRMIWLIFQKRFS